jgi:hypothetical protein
MITNDLTMGRQSNLVTPFTTEEIKKFIEENKAEIDTVIQNIITDYTEDNELDKLEDLLESRKTDWIGEYLYDEIDIRYMYCE